MDDRKTQRFLVFSRRRGLRVTLQGQTQEPHFCHMSKEWIQICRSDGQSHRTSGHPKFLLDHGAININVFEDFQLRCQFRIQPKMAQFCSCLRCVRQ